MLCCTRLARLHSASLHKVQLQRLALPSVRRSARRPAVAIAMPSDDHHASKNGRSRPDIAKDCLEFINYAWTQFHAVEEGSRRLLAAGFEKLSERDQWSLKPGGRYFFTRNLSTLVAFAVGGAYKPGNGFHMIGAHTDSPCLKLKPVTKGKKEPFLMVNVEPYGGGLWHTWFDRDLSLAGRVLLRAPDGTLKHRLVKIERPILRIPMLAIHLSRDIYTDGFKPNKQTHVVPILATALRGALGTPPAAAKDSSATSSKDASSSTAADAPGNNGGETTAAQAAAPAEKHHGLLLQLLADELGTTPDDIVDFELNVCDTQAGVIGGAKEEFLFVGRLDNLAMSFCSLTALLDTYPTAESLADEPAVKAVALFDNEEVGSDSAQGAGGPVMMNTISRVAALLAEGQEGTLQRCLQNSFLVSADMAHALHPNYPEKHEPDHKPQFHAGLVIKHNVNQRYATTAVSAALFKELARERGIPTQEFSVRSDMACGSTIGPILASSLGCRVLDVGAPQLAMHSIREMCGTEDIAHSYEHFCAFFERFSAIDAMLSVDDLPPAAILGSIEDPPCSHVH